MAGLRIPKLKSMSMNKLNSYLKPELVYIPLFLFGSEVEIKVKKGDYVYKGELLGISTGRFNIPIFSSVSGHVVDFTYMTHQSGNKIESIVIENDFKEQLKRKYELRKKINKLSKEEFFNHSVNKEVWISSNWGSKVAIVYCCNSKVS